VEKWDHDAALDPSVLEQLGELGFFGMLVPDEHGGMGFDRSTYLTVLEALSWGEPAIGLTLSIHSAFAATLLIRHGTDDQKARWLPELASGERIGCFALSEEGAGSDAAAASATAERSGDGWVLTGHEEVGHERPARRSGAGGGPYGWGGAGRSERVPGPDGERRVGGAWP
jgi:alkylation response protein AidB-like acyl-CoA dehydrogenase